MTVLAATAAGPPCPAAVRFGPADRTSGALKTGAKGSARPSGLCRAPILGITGPGLAEYAFWAMAQGTEGISAPPGCAGAVSKESAIGFGFHQDGSGAAATGVVAAGTAGFLDIGAGVGVGVGGCFREGPGEGLGGGAKGEAAPGSPRPVAEEGVFGCCV